VSQIQNLGVSLTLQAEDAIPQRSVGKECDDAVEVYPVADAKVYKVGPPSGVIIVPLKTPSVFVVHQPEYRIALFESQGLPVDARVVNRLAYMYRERDEPRHAPPTPTPTYLLPSSYPAYPMPACLAHTWA